MGDLSAGRFLDASYPFITVTVNFAIVSSAKGNRKLVTDLAASALISQQDWSSRWMVANSCWCPRSPLALW